MNAGEILPDSDAASVAHARPFGESSFSAVVASRTTVGIHNLYIAVGTFVSAILIVSIVVSNIIIVGDVKLVSFASATFFYFVFEIFGLFCSLSLYAVVALVFFSDNFPPRNQNATLLLIILPLFDIVCVYGVITIQLY